MDLQDLLEPEHLFVLNRGFRDVDKLDGDQYRAVMPPLKGNLNQLHTFACNHCRQIALIIWVL